MLNKLRYSRKLRMTNFVYELKEFLRIFQFQTLYNIATHPDAYGEPYKWSSHEIGRMTTLFTCESISMFSEIVAI